MRAPRRAFMSGTGPGRPGIGAYATRPDPRLRAVRPAPAGPAEGRLRRLMSRPPSSRPGNGPFRAPRLGSRPRLGTRHASRPRRLACRSPSPRSGGARWRDLLERRVRSVLAVLTIAVGVMAVGTAAGANALLVMAPSGDVPDGLRGSAGDDRDRGGQRGKLSDKEADGAGRVNRGATLRAHAATNLPPGDRNVSLPDPLARHCDRRATAPSRDAPVRPPGDHASPGGAEPGAARPTRTKRAPKDPLRRTVTASRHAGSRATALDRREGATPLRPVPRR